MLTEEKQFVFLLTFIALGWMLGFIWIVVSGTNYYVDHMCFFSFGCDRCSQPAELLYFECAKRTQQK